MSASRLLLKGGPLCSSRIDRHGDLLFVGYQESQQQPEQELAAPPATLNGTRPESTSVAGVSSGSAVKAIKKPWELVKEDPVDTYWEKQDGKIRRSKDSRMCRHGDKSMCDHCMPLEVRPSFGKERGCLADLYCCAAIRCSVPSRELHQAPFLPCPSSETRYCGK